MSTSSIRFPVLVTYGCVLIVGCRRSVSAAWSSCYLVISTSLPFSSAFGLPKCDISHLVDPRSALCSSASVTRHYLVTRRHNIPLPSRTARSQHITTITQVGLCAACTLHITVVLIIRQPTRGLQCLAHAHAHPPLADAHALGPSLCPCFLPCGLGRCIIVSPRAPTPSIV
jgi:hypothetical protein